MLLTLLALQVLNKCKVKNALTVYPYVHQYCNNVCPEDVTHGIQFPDLDPFLPEDSNFSMVAGDFVEVYSDQSYLNSQNISFKFTVTSSILKMLQSPVYLSTVHTTSPSP